jgi:DNA-directed RNA polymerase specialized sigma24 family protein
MNDVTAAQAPIETPSVWTIERVFEAYHPWIRTWIYSHLFTADWHLAEDLASETFVRLVRTYGTDPIEADRVRGLLVTVARHAIRDHFQTRRSGETPTDFSDPVQARKVEADSPAEDEALVRLQARQMLADRPYTTLASTLAQVDRLFALVVAA